MTETPKAALTGAILRVEADNQDGDGPQLCQGHVRLYVGDIELTHVQRVELIAETGSLWRAKVECLVKPPSRLIAGAIIRYPNIWQRFKRWLRLAAKP